MSRTGKGLLVLAMVAALAAPLLAVHSLLLHVSGADQAHLVHRSADPGIVLLAAFALLASLPALGMIVGLMRWLRAAKRLGAMRAASTAGELNGICYRRIDSPEVALFSAGFWRPEIFATTGAEQLLPAASLKAALLHEVAHVRAGDTRWRAALAAVRGGFGLLPYVSRYLGTLVLQSEVAADRAATLRGAGRADLFEALVAASGVQGAAAGLADGCVATRLEHLVDPARERPEPPRPGALSIAAWSVGVPLLPHVLLLAGLFGQPHFA